MGKHKHIQSQSFKKDVKKEVMASKWGRDAYDDGNDSDESSIAGSYENLSKLKLKIKSSGQTAPAPKALVKTPERQISHKPLIRRDTPRPNNETFKNLPLDLDEKKTDNSQESPVAAPITKIASARSKSNKPPAPLTTPPALPVVKEKEIDYSTQKRAQMIPALNRQTGFNQDEEENSDNTDDESSSEEDSSEYDTSESSDTDDDDDDRPIMAQNIGIHGAKIAKQVMQRMKNQRYPSIFSKPIITLDTIVDIRFERPYQTVSQKQAHQNTESLFFGYC